MKRLLITALLGLLGTPLCAQVGISPQYHEIQLDTATTSHTFRLFNFTDEEKTFQVSVNHWDFDDHNQVVAQPAGPDNLARWLIVNPTRFTVPPGEHQVVRFAAHPAIRLDPGEHRAMIFFDEELTEEQIESASGLRLRVRVGAAVYGQIGARERAGYIESVHVEDGVAHLTLTNTGSANIRLRGDWALWSAAHFPGESRTRPGAAGAVNGEVARQVLPTTPVLPGRTQTLRFALSQAGMQPGERYVLDINALLADQSVSLATPFTYGH